MLLKHMKFEVEVAFSGPEGIEVARQSSPEVVLCDIGLPGLDGYDVARALRTDHATRDAFLIAQSGYGQAEDVRKAYEAGFNVHLIKPVDFQELQRILRSNRRLDVMQSRHRACELGTSKTMPAASECGYADINP